MKTVLSACVALWLVAMATAEDIPKCHGVTDEQITKIKSMVVKEDIHDKLTGNYSQVYGPKVMVDADASTCIEFTYKKTDDKNIDYTLVTDGDWFKDEKKREGTLHKVTNGIYLIKKPETKAVVFFLFSKGSTLAQYTCWTDVPVPNSIPAKITSVTSIFSAERPLKEKSTKHVGEAKVMIKAHPDVFGEIGYYNDIHC